MAAQSAIECLRARGVSPGLGPGEGGAVYYRPYLDRLRQRPDLDGLTIIDLLDHPFDPNRFNLRPFRGHASPYGNRVIAEAVHAALEP